MLVTQNKTNSTNCAEYFQEWSVENYKRMGNLQLIYVKC